MSPELWDATHVVNTSAGLCGLWQPEQFAHVTSLDTWEDEVLEESALRRQIEAGAFVPLNVGGDGVFQVTLRDAGRNSREARYSIASSEPYLLILSNTLALGGLEKVGSVDDVVLIPFKRGRFAVTIHLIDWKAEPNSTTDEGKPANGALPDFLVEINAESAPPTGYRTSVETFIRP